MIHVVNFNFEIPERAHTLKTAINTTSRSTNWSQGLSPFLCGPCELYNGFVGQNVENSWQYSKVYEYYTTNGEPDERYFKWAEEGWNKAKADRYPMGREAKPLYSYWDGEKLSYVEARKKIYIPLYSQAVRQTPAFAQLKKIHDNLSTILDPLYLQDFDAHNLEPGTYQHWDLVNNPKIKVGHAYVLAMMLEELI